MDKRASSGIIGAIGGGVILLFFALVIVIDLARISRDLWRIFWRVFRILFGCLREYIVFHPNPTKDLVAATYEPFVTLALGMSMKAKKKLAKKRKESPVPSGSDENRGNTSNGNDPKDIQKKERFSSVSADIEVEDLEDLDEDITDIDPVPPRSEAQTKTEENPKKVSISDNIEMEYFINNKISNILNGPSFTRALEPAYKSTNILLHHEVKMVATAPQNNSSPERPRRTRPPPPVPPIKKPDWRYWK